MSGSPAALEAPSASRPPSAWSPAPHREGPLRQSGSQPGRQGPMCPDPAFPFIAISCCPLAAPAPHPSPSPGMALRGLASLASLPLSGLCPLPGASPSDPRLSNTTPSLCSPNPPYSHSTLYHTLDFIHSFIYTFVHSFIHFLHLSMFLLSLPCARHCDVHFSYIFSFRPFNDPESSIIII